ncbi:RNA-dependent DNA polymerase [Cobetia sp. cqz5-12]|uniref:reverse transcriptase domain-containing protein n=1 Tax=Cobetia sp. cqz5-12 TaxID=2609415 RepID=UPI001907DC44|nr:reverse transcriptase domain-containing protein [Cobetia sp. cqz5-12]QQK64907.1 RNA-dependent DNA polymerase [Cobetia sp. cqz5-12]
MKTVKQDFHDYFSYENLKNIFLEDVKLSNVMGVDNITPAVFERELEGNIKLIERKVIDGTYRFTRYKEKVISKGAKKLPRVVYIPTIRDRITLKALNQFLQRRLGNKTKQSIPQNVTRDIKKSLTKKEYNWVVKLDISNFYPSIRHEELKKRLRRFIRDDNIISLIDKAISRASDVIAGHKVGVPQGLSISNILSAIYLRNLDSNFQSSTSVFYRRYVDDIFILCNKDESEAHINYISNHCKKTGLKVYTPEGNPEKSTSCRITNNFSYVGYVYEAESEGYRNITARKSSKQKLIDSLTGIYTAYASSRNKSIPLLKWRLDLRITGCISENKGKGWLFFFSEINDLQLLHELDLLIKRLNKRFKVDMRNKSFVRAWHEINYNRWRNNYFPNFDRFDHTHMRMVIALYRNCNPEDLKLSDKEVAKIFNNIKRREVKALESDIQSFS